MKNHSIDNEDNTGKNFSDDFFVGTKTFFFILSIPFLMVLGKFLIVWDVGEFILSTFTCACIIGTILLGGKTNDND